MKKNIQLTFMIALLSTQSLIADPIKLRCVDGYAEMLESNGTNVNADKVAEHCGTKEDKSCFASSEPTIASVIELLKKSNCALKKATGDEKTQSQCDFKCESNIGIYKQDNNIKTSNVLRAAIWTAKNKSYKYYIFNMFPGDPDK